jgi:hypothetical protein
VTTPVLRWDVSCDLPRVDETVAICDDGTVWLWVGAGAEPDRRDVAGCFRTPDGDLARARELAAQLEPGEGPAPVRGLSVRVTGDRGTVEHDTADARADEVVAALLELGAAAAAQAVHQPVAAVRLQGEFRRLPPSTGMAPRVAFRLIGLGSQGSRLLADPDRLSARWLAASGADVGWSQLGRPAVGFVDDRARLVDGLHAVAHVSPAQQVALVTALPDPPAGAVALSVRLVGRLARFDWTGSARDPRSSIDLESAPVPLG